MGLIKWAERKFAMQFVEKLIAGVIERVWGNKITTVIGALILIGGAVVGLSNVVDPTVVWHGIHVKEGLVTLAGVIAGVAALLKDSEVKLAKPKIVLLCLALTATTLKAQAPAPTPADTQNFVAGGLSFNPGATPDLAGTGIYGRKVAENTWAVSIWDAMPATKSPFTVTTTSSVGVAQKLFDIGKLPVYCLTAAGFAWTGQNAGWGFSGGCATTIAIKGKWFAMPIARFAKSSIGGDGYHPIVGATFGLQW